MPVIRSLVMNELMTGKVSKTIRLVELLYIYMYIHITSSSFLVLHPYSVIT